MPHYKQKRSDSDLKTAGGHLATCFPQERTEILLQKPMQEMTPQAPAPITRRSVLSGPHTICSMRAVVTGKQAFDTAKVLVRLKKDGWLGFLGIESSRAPSIVVDNKNGVQHDSLNDTVLKDGRYQQTITDLHDGDPKSWEGVPSNENHDRVGCVCRQTFDAIFACDIRVHRGLVGPKHDIAPEARPRLATAWVLMDVVEENVFQAVIAAGAQRLCSRGHHVESSTSTEQRTVLCALQDVKDMLPQNSALLLSTDSDGTRQAIEECCLRYCLPRRFTRTPEAGTLRAILGHTDDLQTKKIDVQAAWEPACHDRVKRQITDGAGRTLARLNHACDRLADMVVVTGR